MFNKPGSLLTSIPENEEETKRWVPEKKHAVLKAKYKCLKKLFQIYDASVIGILPEQYGDERPSGLEDEDRSRSRRKRSHRTKTDVCAATSAGDVSGDVSNGVGGGGNDVTDASGVDEASTIATAVMQELKMRDCSCASTQADSEVSRHERYASMAPSRSDMTDKESEGVQVSEMAHHPMLPHLFVNERPKLTRFQCFIQRIFGIRSERPYRTLLHPDGHIIAASDNQMMPHVERRRRRGLRFRKLRRPRKVQSEGALRRARSPTLLACAQSVQRTCLMDTTPRQCPILGCRTIFYGIINYNDHLNLCHFTSRRFVCHYCHEGFEREDDKLAHQLDHIGVSRLTEAPLSWQQRQASITQTEPDPPHALPEEKLKKIVSFFDKIADPEQMLSEIKKNRYSESNLQSWREEYTPASATEPSECDKRAASCVQLNRKKKSVPVAGRFCDSFGYRRQPPSPRRPTHLKYHSCTAVPHTPGPRSEASTEGPPSCAPSTLVCYSSLESVQPKCAPASCTVVPHTPAPRSEASTEGPLSRAPSTLVCYSSLESVQPKNAPARYRWEPGTEIIRI